MPKYDKVHELREKDVASGPTSPGQKVETLARYLSLQTRPLRLLASLFLSYLQRAKCPPLTKPIRFSPRRKVKLARHKWLGKRWKRVMPRAKCWFETLIGGGVGAKPCCHICKMWLQQTQLSMSNIPDAGFSHAELSLNGANPQMGVVQVQKRGLPSQNTLTHVECQSNCGVHALLHSFSTITGGSLLDPTKHRALRNEASVTRGSVSASPVLS